MSNISIIAFLLTNLLIGILQQCCFAMDAMNSSQQLFPGQTLVSVGYIFEMGFFTAGSNRSYVGIWYRNISGQTTVWVANREKPLAANDTGSNLAIGIDGNLRLQDGNRKIVWSSNVSIHSNKTSAMLTDDGNLVLTDDVSGLSLWESFDSPGNTLLSGMMTGYNTKTGEKRFLSSWKSENDPSPGNFTVGLSEENPPQGFIWNGLNPWWRAGPWDGWQFKGVPGRGRGYINGFSVVTNVQLGTVYFTFNKDNHSVSEIIVLTPEGSFKWMEAFDEWSIIWEAPANRCEEYGFCGPGAVCTDMNGSPSCRCLKGYVPKSSEEWSKDIWGAGCVRRAQFRCENNSSNSDISKTKNDGFLKLSRIKLPDLYHRIDNESPSECRQWCLNNCSCVAYSNPEGIGCLVWLTDLIDLQKFSSEGDDFFLRLACSELGAKKKWVNIIIGFTIAAVILLLIIVACLYRCWKAKKRGTQAERVLGLSIGLPTDSTEIPIIDFLTISKATGNFSNANKLGEGGFGPVYKGKLDDGEEVAVKRLSSFSVQGNEEFKNEILLISKLQHRNLVRLLGYSIHGEEKLIVYEYMKNKSLDSFLFDPAKKLLLGWTTRFNIIQGIAKGLLYLHRDSYLRVIHRDLKASNILLEDDMTPKISDFGLARAFSATQSLANTHRVVGTFGYMSPEYVIGGLFSEKSDVYSFGVILLEILSGMKNTGSHYDEPHVSLISYAWGLWDEGKGLDFMDQSMADSELPYEAMRYLHIGLLCVQDHAADRPTMPAIIMMLSSENDLPRPKHPMFPFHSLLDYDLGVQTGHAFYTNEFSTSILEGR